MPPLLPPHPYVNSLWKKTTVFLRNSVEGSGVDVGNARAASGVGALSG